MSAVERPRFPHLVIRASAGSGKTYQLTLRYVALLAAGESPDRILATTFTRKAAGEILQRVLLRLVQAHTDPVDCRRLGKEIGIRGFDSARALDLLVRMLRRLHRLRICTLDSFFLQIAGCFGLELGLPPGWTIVEDDAEQRLKEAAVQALLQGQRPEALLGRIRRLVRGSLQRGVVDRIQKIIGGLYDLYLDTEDRPQAWTVPPSRWKIEAEALCGEIDRLERAEVALTGKGEPDKNWVKDRANAVESARREDWEKFVKSGFTASVLNASPLHRKKEYPLNLLEALRPLLLHAGAVLQAGLAERTAGIRDILADFAQACRELQAERGVLRFGDVTRLLARAALADRLSDVYYRLDGRIAHLLLDEFQDTSLPQWQVLSPFSDEVVSHADGSHSFFCVGDAKQAIYGWRGGVAEIFDHLDERYPGVGQESLHVSHRSAPPILDAVNAVFGTLEDNGAFRPEGDPSEGRPDLRGAARAWAQGYEKHETAKKDLPGFVRLSVLSSADEPEGEGADPMAAAAGEVERLAKESPAATIGVLVRDNKAVGALIHELRLRGVEASEEGGNPLTDSPAVTAVLSLVSLADHPGDRVARFHVSRSPLGPVAGLPEEADEATAGRVAAGVRRALLERGTGAVVLDWVRALAPACDPRDLQRLVQLTGLAHLQDAERSARPAEFVSRVRSRKVEDPTPARVRVMTIHQAKGLEFDIVVLPELDVPLHKLFRGIVAAARDEGGGPVRAVCAYAGNEICRVCPDVREIHQDAVLREVRESLSVLYVAMTRPIHALHLLVKPGEKFGETYAGILRAALAPDREAVAGAGLYEGGDPRWHQKEFQVPGSTFQVKPVEAVAWNLELGTRNSPRGLPRRTPSDLEGGGRVDLARRMRLDATPALNRGTLFHAFLERIEWLENAGPGDEALRGIVRRCGFPASEADGLIREFREMLTRPAVRGALVPPKTKSGPKERFEVWRERAFAVRDGDAVMTGTFDRVVVAFRGDAAVRADVIDYKTDAVPPGPPAALDALVDHYRPQLEAYRRAVAALTGLPPARIGAKLLFAVAGVARGLP